MEEVVRAFLSTGDADAHQRAIDYFEELKHSRNGWRQSLETVIGSPNLDGGSVFFYLSVIEHHVKVHYASAGEDEQRLVRTFFEEWLARAGQRKSEVFVANKFAHIVSQIVLVDFPARWRTFFNDLLRITTQLGWDLYLRILIAINQSIAEREVQRSAEEAARGTLIKDTMREICVPQLVDSWYNILVTTGCPPSVTAQCLLTVGMYVSWIDLSLVCNSRFMQVLVNCFCRQNEVREATIDCITEIIHKGMEPAPKIQLVISILDVFQPNLQTVTPSTADEDIDCVIKLSTMLNIMTSHVLNACTKLLPRKSNDLQEDQASIVRTGHEVIEQRLFPIIEKYLAHPDDDVSAAVTECIREYLQYIKQKPCGEVQRDIVQRLLFIIVNKYKFDADYDFESNGGEEADFIQFRRTLKVLFDNITQLDRDLVSCFVRELLRTTLPNWKTLPFQDVEVAIAFLYLLGESSAQHNVAISVMVADLVASEVSNHPHSSVRLQFFETCGRYDKVLTAQMLPPVIAAFLDGRGLRAAEPSVRSRCSYLFAKIIKTSKSKLENYIEEILCRLHDLLLLPQLQQVNEGSRLSTDDQLYLYEATSILVISSQFPAEKKESLLRQLLTPVIQSYSMYTTQLNIQPEPLRNRMAELMSHAIHLTSRTSKAFSNTQTMRACNCVQIYTDAIAIFDKALSLSKCEDSTVTLIYSALRQFLHRMVVCLDSEDMLPLLPHPLAALLGIHVPISLDFNLADRSRPLQETIPLVTQILAKFKRDCIPLMRELFLPTLDLIFKCLEVPIETSDLVSLKERQMLQRAYFNLIFAMVTSDVLADVIPNQDSQRLEQVLTTIIQGAVNLPDPVSQKTCFATLRKMVEAWGKNSDNVVFMRFLYDAILPACFQAPLQASFNLDDAQTALVLSETACCLQGIHKVRNNELLVFLSTELLPKLNLDVVQMQEYRHQLQQDIKIFRPYLKRFFEHLRKRNGM
ncbi:exportin-T [Galendromus occidentalis]|uniref:Exportin-T n=1 Tax=Galendromus occidentalis TaxID=34638 RepID=A0AAJ7L5G8_9ACAR|nr:exportin-T [Galendromus occidentalis]